MSVRDKIASSLPAFFDPSVKTKEVASDILATIKASVPELVWSKPDADPYQHQMSGAYEVTKLGQLYFHLIKLDDISTDLIGKFGTREDAKAAAQAHHVAQKTDWMMG